MDSYVDIVFDGPPAHESGRFVEVEDADGASIAIGEWVRGAEPYWRLRIPDPRKVASQVAALAEARGLLERVLKESKPEPFTPHGRYIGGCILSAIARFLALARPAPDATKEQA
jgi:hypothetical protein